MKTEYVKWPWQTVVANDLLDCAVLDGFKSIQRIFSILE